MTGSVFLSTVRALLGIPSDYARLTDAQIQSFFDAVAGRLAAEAEPVELQDVDRINLTADDATYDCTKKFLTINTVKANGVTLTPISFEDLDRIDPRWETSDAQSGSPQYYTIEGATAAGLPKLRLNPTPNETVSEGLVVRGIVEPTPLATVSTGEIVQFPEYLHDPLAQIVARRASLHLPERTGLDGRVKEWLANYLDAYTFYINRQQLAHKQKWGQTPVAGMQGGWELPSGW